MDKKINFIISTTDEESAKSEYSVDFTVKQGKTVRFTQLNEKPYTIGKTN